MNHHHQGGFHNMHHHHHNGGGFHMPGQHQGGFVPQHVQHYMNSQGKQHHHGQATAAKEVHPTTKDAALSSPSKGNTSTDTPGATPSRHLNFSNVENTPVQNNATKSNSTGGRTLPHVQQAHHQMMMMQQAHLMASGGRPMPPHPQPEQQFTKRLERELHDGSKEDLVKLVMELCDLNNEVNNYVESKAQLFALKPNQECASPYSYTSTTGGSPRSHDTAVPYTTETPLKQGAESIVTDSADAKGGVTPQTPLEALHRDLESRHCTSEDRAFSQELHPCLRLYSNCRYPSSCFFRTCPRNLCINFLRGECTAGKDCSLVHRIPANATPQILHMVGVCRGEAVTIPDAAPSSRELFNASSCSDVANMTLDEEGHAATA